MTAITLRIVVTSLFLAFASADAQNGQTVTNAVHVALGSTKADVIAKLGEPQGFLKEGETELFVYKAMDVRFQNGRVVEVKRLKTGAADATDGWRQRLVEEAPVPQPTKPTPPQASTDGQQTPVSTDSAPATAAEEVVLLDKETPTGTVSARFGRKKTGPPTVMSRVMLYGGIAVGAIGLLGAMASGIWFLVKAFKVHVGWGLACIFLPFANLVFLIMHWEESYKPFLANIGAACLAGGGFYLAFLSLVR